MEVKNGIIIDRVLHESSEGFCNECSLCQECSNLLDDNYCALLDLGIGQCFVSRGKITEIKTRIEMNDILFKKIKRANSKYAEYLSACDKVAKAAQKHINWNDSVGCAYMPGDGLCIEIEAHVCPATRFFELPEIIGNDMIDEYTYRTNCI